MHLFGMIRRKSDMNLNVRVDARFYLRIKKWMSNKTNTDFSKELRKMLDAAMTADGVK